MLSVRYEIIHMYDMFTKVNSEVIIVYSIQHQKVMQNEQSNGLILKLLVIIFELVNLSERNRLSDWMNPDRSIITTHTRDIKMRFRNVIMILEVFYDSVDFMTDYSLVYSD
jgi:hypothetical protein